MNYLETLLLIQEREEKYLASDTRSIITDKHRYVRGLDAPESAWREDTEPGKPEKRFGRGGEYWVWKRDDAPDDKPMILPEGT
jgi:hypothetical protein